MRLPGLVVGLLCVAAVAQAETEGEEVVLRTQALEARRTGEWKRALRACGDLAVRRPLDADMLVVAAEAHVALGEDVRAAERLDAILATHEHHVVALWMRAQILARQGQKDLARDHLIQAAQAGRQVLRDLSTPEGQKDLGWVLREPPTILRIMQAHGVEARNASRSPFKSPLRRIGPGDPPPPPPPSEEVLRLEKEIEALLADLDGQMATPSPDVERLSADLDRLLELLDRHARLPRADVAAMRRRIDRWGARHGSMSDLRRRVWVRLLGRDANRALREMTAAFEEEDWEAVARHMTTVDGLAGRLRTGGPEGERLAEALLIRAGALADEARIRERIARLPLEVTGIVIAPPGEPSSAIVADRPVTAGEELHLDAEGVAVAIVAIGPAGVRFRWGGVEFSRPLKARDLPTR